MWSWKITCACCLSCYEHHSFLLGDTQQLKIVSRPLLRIPRFIQPKNNILKPQNQPGTLLEQLRPSSLETSPARNNQLNVTFEEPSVQALRQQQPTYLSIENVEPPKQNSEGNVSFRIGEVPPLPLCYTERALLKKGCLEQPSPSILRTVGKNNRPGSGPMRAPRIFSLDVLVVHSETISSRKLTYHVSGYRNYENDSERNVHPPERNFTR